MVLFIEGIEGCISKYFIMFLIVIFFLYLYRLICKLTEHVYEKNHVSRKDKFLFISQLIF